MPFEEYNACEEYNAGITHCANSLYLWVHVFFYFQEEQLEDSDFDVFSDDEFMSQEAGTDDDAQGDTADEGNEAAPCIKQAAQLAQKLINNSDNVSFNEVSEYSFT